MIFIAIPAYNEADNIGLLLERILALGYAPSDYQVIVINDGSTDGMLGVISTFCARMPVTVVSHEANRGVGQVFRTAFAAVLERAQSADILVTMEADNTSDLGILKKMIGEVERGSDVVLASAYAAGGGIEGSNFVRHGLSMGANVLLKLAFPIGINTYSSFYRAYRMEVLRRAQRAYGDRLIEEAGFVCMAEVAVKLNRLGFRLTEVPMVLKTDLRRGKSKMKVLRTIWGYLRFIGRDVLSGVRPARGAIPG